MRGHGLVDSGFYEFVEENSGGLGKACSWIGGEISKVQTNTAKIYPDPNTELSGLDCALQMDLVSNPFDLNPDICRNLILGE